MNIAMSALSGSGGGAGGDSAPGTGMMSGGSSGSGSGTWSALQAGSTAVSILGTLGAAKAKSSAYLSKAADDRLNSDQAFTVGQGEVGGLRAQLMNTLSQRTAAAGAGGVDVGQGVVQDTNKAVTTQNDAASDLTTTSADIRSRRYQISALNNEIEARNAKQAGMISSIGQGLSLASSLLGRG